MNKFDLIVIGSGPAGFSAAMRAVDYKQNVCIVEKNEIGGAGIMNGALTSKTMWELSSDYSVATSTDRGYSASSFMVDYNKVRKTVIEAAKDRQYQLLSQIETFYKNSPSEGKITLKYGHAKFISKTKIEINKNDKKETIEGKYIIIATGSKPRDYPGMPSDGKQIVNSDTILNLEKFPERLLIIGSGIIGCEFAAIFSNFKQTKVHLLDRTNRVVPFEDDDVSDFVSEQLENNGVKIHYNANLRTIHKKGDFLEVILDYEGGHSKVIEVDAALVSIGRIPNTQNLGLENIGFKQNKKGVIKTDNFCDIEDLDNCNIFAAGDITGHGQLYNVAQVQGRYIVDAIFNKSKNPVSYKNMSTLMFFKPEVAAVGYNEKQLRQKNIPYRMAYYSNELVSRNIAMRSTTGFVKIIVSCDGEDKILGMRAAGPQASAFIVSVAHLIDEKNGLNEVFKTVHPHPGVTEGLEECLRLFAKSSVMKPEAFPELIKYEEWKPATE